MGHQYGRDPVERESNIVADQLDNNDAYSAANRLRQDMVSMYPEDFSRLVNRTMQKDEKGYGADLVIVNQSAGRDECGRQITDRVLGVQGYDQWGNSQFHRVGSLGQLGSQYRCDGGDYYPPRPLPVPQWPHPNNPIYRPTYPYGHGGNGGIIIGPGGNIIIDIPLGGRNRR